MLTALTVIFGIATFAGVALAIYYGRREGRRRKILAYHASRAPWPIASSASLATYNLSLMYEPQAGGDHAPYEIDSAYAHYLTLVNFGREPIRRSDIASANPLRVGIEGTTLLDARLEAVRRDVCCVALGEIESAAESASVKVTFEFLDFQDGALIRLLTTSRPSRVWLEGDIVGMPEGIRRAEDLRRRGVWAPLGMSLAILLQIGGLALTALIFRWVLGSWDSVWLMVLPIIALFLPLAISITVAETIWPKPQPPFPKELLPVRFRHGYPIEMMMFDAEEARFFADGDAEESEPVRAS